MCMWEYCEDSFAVYRSEFRKARKPHRCCECNRVIETGEEHHYAFGVCDGNSDTYRTCMHCRVACSWLSHECGGFVHLGVLEDLEEHVREYRGQRPVFDLARLVVGMQRQWRRLDAAYRPAHEIAPRMALPRIPAVWSAE
jgi:hypothetical protein